MSDFYTQFHNRKKKKRKKQLLGHEDDVEEIPNYSASIPSCGTANSEGACSEGRLCWPEGWFGVVIQQLGFAFSTTDSGILKLEHVLILAERRNKEA